MKSPYEVRSVMTRQNPFGCFRQAGRPRPRHLMLRVEPMESRLCLSAGTQVPVGSGVDSIAMGDVNGDQVADVAVASAQNGQYQVAIYSGPGQADGSLPTGYAPHLLATIPDPFSPAAGPLDAALGDFAGNGISDWQFPRSIQIRSLSAPLSSLRLPRPMDP